MCVCFLNLSNDITKTNRQDNCVVGNRKIRIMTIQVHVFFLVISGRVTVFSGNHEAEQLWNFKRFLKVGICLRGQEIYVRSTAEL